MIPDNLSAGIRVGAQGIPLSPTSAAFLVNVPNSPLLVMGWRYLPYAFVHADIIHMGLNAVKLFLLGRIF
jgi:membrane associated rhomboid family serine protease